MNDEVENALVLAIRACGSLKWLGNNMHQYGSDLFKELLQGAIEDADIAYNACKPVVDHFSARDG